MLLRRAQKIRHCLDSAAALFFGELVFPLGFLFRSSTEIWHGQVLMILTTQKIGGALLGDLNDSFLRA